MLFSCPRCTGGAHLASRNRNLGALPKMVDFLPANMVGNTENPWFFKKIAENGAFTGKLRDFRGFAGFQHFDISNGKLLLGLLLPNSAYKRCHLHKAAGGSRGSPPFRRLRWQETRKIHGFLGKLLENGAYWQIARFSRFCGFPAISTSPTKNWCLVFCYQILLIKCAIHIKHAEGKRKLM